MTKNLNFCICVIWTGIQKLKGKTNLNSVCFTPGCSGPSVDSVYCKMVLMTGHLLNDEQNLISKALGRHTQTFPSIKSARSFHFQWCVGKLSLLLLLLFFCHFLHLFFCYSRDTCRIWIKAHIYIVINTNTDKVDKYCCWYKRRIIHWVWILLYMNRWDIKHTVQRQHFTTLHCP